MENSSNFVVKRINVNKMPKVLKIIFWLLPLVLFLSFISHILDNDFYFLYPTGEYIVNNGFPFKDFLSWHNNMDIIVQQWLSTIVFYYAYHYLGIAGLAALMCVCAITLYSLYYKLLYSVTDNYFISLVFSTVSLFIISVAYIITRPQIFTFNLIVLELVALELFIKKNKIGYLFIIPIISVLLVNFHSAMWMMIFVFMLPYFAQSLPVKFGKFKQKPCCSFFKLLLTAAVAFAVGFINPYGIKAMFYIFSSYGISSINDYINEMLPVTIASYDGKFLFALLLVTFYLFNKYKKGKFELRFVLLALGTFVLALSSGKSLPYFYISFGLLCASYFKDFSFEFKFDKPDKNEKVNWKKILALFAVLALVCAGAFAFSSDDNTNESNSSSSIEAKQLSMENDLDVIIDYLNTHDTDGMVLFNSFNCGQYLEFNGIPAFIDGRAELFFERNNHEADYFEDLYGFEKGTIYYSDFIDKYDFTHLIVQQSKPIVYKALLNDDCFEEIIRGDEYSLFIRK